MIRRMTEADLLAVVRLEQENFSVPWTEAGLRESLNLPEYLFLVAEEERKVVGYAGLYRVLDEGDVTNIVVDEQFRGKGIGTHLTRELLEEGKKEGVRAFTLEVRFSNMSAIRIYERLGFVQEGIRKGFYEKPLEDARIMWKREPEQ